MSDPFGDPRKVGAHLVDRQGRRVVPGPRRAPAVVIVHGLGADYDQHRAMARALEKRGWEVMLLRYPSGQGIENASRQLANELRGHTRAEGWRGFALVGHSMGGLVCRHLAQAHAGSALEPRAMIFLGTPHHGALVGLGAAKAMNLFLKYDAVRSRLDPRDDFRPAVEELIGRDTPRRRGKPGGNDRPEEQVSVRLLQWMNRQPPLDIPTLSISGGLPHLDFPLLLRPLNAFIQRHYKGEANDGLVLEASADVTRLIPEAVHWNAYPAYPKINHTNLTAHGAVHDKVHEFLRGAFREDAPAQAEQGGG